MRRSIVAGIILAAAFGFGDAWAAKVTPSLHRPYKSPAPKLDDGPLLTTAQGTTHLDREHYRSVRDAALAMMEKFPPASHYYIALGRSPVSIYTFLKSLSPDLTTTFPASDLRLGITPEHHAAYFRHFEHFIPADVLQGKRGDIVLFDRSHDRSGSSLALLKPLLEKYLADKGYKTKVIALGFAGAGPLQRGVRFMSTRRFPKVFLYFNGADHDEEVATYLGKHTIGTHGVRQITRNPEHRSFLDAMEERMAADRELDKTLRTAPHLKRLASAQ